MYIQTTPKEGKAMNAKQNHKEPKTTIIYCRTSSEGGDEKISVDLQEENCRKLAMKLGLEVKDVIKERNFSGSLWADVPARKNDEGAKDKIRPGFTKAVKMLESGKVDSIMVNDTTRLGRPATNAFLGWQFDFLQRHFVYSCEVGGRVNYTDFSTYLTEVMKSIINRNQINRQAASSKEAKAKMKASGGLINAPPYGFRTTGRQKVEIVPQEAEAIRLIYSLWIDKGYGQLRICNELSKAGYKPKRGTSWHSKCVYDILHNPAYCGKYYDPQGLLHDSPIYKEPIISFEDWGKIRGSEREIKAMGQSRKQYKQRWLQGTLYCGTCGNPLQIGCGTYYVDKATGKRITTHDYRCRRSDCKNKVGIHAHEMEAIAVEIVNMFDKYVEAHGSFFLYKDRLEEGIFAELSKLEAELDRLQRNREGCFSAGFKPADMLKALESIDMAMEVVKKELNELQGQIRTNYPKGATLRAKWQWITSATIIKKTPHREVEITFRMPEKGHNVLRLEAAMVANPTGRKNKVQWLTKEGKDEILRMVSSILVFDDTAKHYGWQASFTKAKEGREGK